MENNQLDNLCDQIIEREIKPLGLVCRYKIENYLDGYSLESPSLKSPGFSEEVKKNVLKKLNIKKEHTDYNYKKKSLNSREKEDLRIIKHESSKFEKRSARKGYLKLQEHFKVYISNPKFFRLEKFPEYYKNLKNLNKIKTIDFKKQKTFN